MRIGRGRLLPGEELVSRRPNPLRNVGSSPQARAGCPRRRIATLLAFTSALILLAAACGGDETESGGSGREGEGQALEATSVRITAGPPAIDSITDAKWFELLEEAGLTVENLEFPFGPPATRALVAGESDLSVSAPLPFLQYLAESDAGGITVLAAETLRTDYVLLATPDVSSVEDLAGKKVGISEPGDISDSLTRVVLEEAGVDITTVDFPQIGGTSDRIAALSAGQVSAGAAHLGDALVAAEQVDLHVLVDYWDYIDTYAQRFLVANDEWLNTHPNLAQLVVDKLLEANEWAVENKDEYIELSQEYVEDVSDEIRNQVYDLFLEEGFFAPDGGLDAIEATVEVEKAQGTLESGDLQDTSEWVDPTFVQNFLAQHS